jgi:dephospho-CoA kinase
MNSSNLDVGLKAKTPLLKIAVTGSAGSGKTAVCDRLKALGLPVIHTDTLAREVAAPGTHGLFEIVQRFGPKVLQADGSLNRAALRRTITRDEAARRSLENIIHPKIIERMEAEMNRAVRDGRALFFVEVPLLFEAGWNDYFDVIVMVSADDEKRIERLMARDNVSRQDARALLRIQKPDHEKIQHSDFIIKNNGSGEHLIAAIDRFLKKFYQKYPKTMKALDSQIFML